MVDLKIFDVATWKTNNCNTHYANISRNKGNQSMQSGQLINYNTKSIFLEKSYTKFGNETIPRHFPKKLKLSEQSEVL